MTHQEQIERTQMAVHNAVHELQQLAIYEPSRPLSLAITNAQQAAMWHGWHEGEQDRYVSPFPSLAHADYGEDVGPGPFLSGASVAEEDVANSLKGIFPTVSLDDD